MDMIIRCLAKFKCLRAWTDNYFLGLMNNQYILDVAAVHHGGDKNKNKEKRENKPPTVLFTHLKHGTTKTIKIHDQKWMLKENHSLSSLFFFLSGNYQQPPTSLQLLQRALGMPILSIYPNSRFLKAISKAPVLNFGLTT